MPILHQGNYCCMLALDDVHSEKDLPHDRRIAGYPEKRRDSIACLSHLLMAGEKQYAILSIDLYYHIYRSKKEETAAACIAQAKGESVPVSTEPETEGPVPEKGHHP